MLAEIERAPDPRFREVMSALVRHLHAFAREVRLTEEEFQTRLRHHRRARPAHHREPQRGRADGGLARLLDARLPPQQRRQRRRPRPPRTCSARSGGSDSPPTENGGSIVRSPTPGEPIFVDACDQGPRRQAGRRRRGRRLAFLDRRLLREPGSRAGRHEPARQVHHRRGRPHRFRSIKPAGYPIPVDGPVGDLLRAQGRANMRPAHLHFLIYKPGFKTHISQVYSDDDPHLETDSQFGVTRGADRPLCPPRRAGAGAGREGAVVFARIHLHDRARHRQAAAAADHRQGAGRAAGDRAAQAGVRRMSTFPQPK